MKVHHLVLSMIAVASFAILALAGPGFADKGVPDIAPHQHFIVTATVSMGDPRCDRR